MILGRWCLIRPPMTHDQGWRRARLPPDRAPEPDIRNLISGSPHKAISLRLEKSLRDVGVGERKGAGVNADPDGTRSPGRKVRGNRPARTRKHNRKRIC